MIPEEISQFLNLNQEFIIETKQEVEFPQGFQNFCQDHDNSIDKDHFVKEQTDIESFEPNQQQIPNAKPNPMSKPKGKLKQMSKENSINTKPKDLPELTASFIQLVLSNGKNQLSLREAGQILNIKKRRLYDITNTLQSFGFIERIGVNLIARKMDSLTASQALNSNLSQDMIEKLLQKSKQARNDKKKIVQSIKQEVASIGQENNMKIPMEKVMETMKRAQKDSGFVVLAREGCQVQYEKNSQEIITVRIRKSEIKNIHFVDD